MSVMSWLREKLWGSERDVVAEAIAAMDDATVKVRSVRQQLEPYRHEDDPFFAIHRKQIMTERYEAAQVEVIHRGPLP